MINKFIKMMKKREKNEKGFTLVELMVVVVIIGVLTAIAVPVYHSVTDKAEKNAIKANLRIIDGAIGMYSAEEQLTEEQRLALKITPTTSAPKDEGEKKVYDALMKYIQEWPSGPDGTKYGVENGEAISDPALTE